MPCALDGCEKPTTRGYRICRMHRSRMERHGNYEGLRPEAPPEVRFWRYVQRGGPNECWPWLAETDPVRQYGTFYVSAERPRVSTHRYSYEMHVGPIPDGLWVLHSCDFRRCVNPAHLRVGTATDNNRDTALRSRRASR